MGKSGKWIFVLLIGLCCAVWWFWGHSKKEEKNVDNQNVQNHYPVRTITLKWSDERSFNEFAGTVDSVITAQISSRIVAHIQEIPVHAGTLVKKGDLIVRLDDGDIKARLKQAQSMLVAAEATRDEALKDVTRYKDLVRKNIESTQKLDQIETRAKNAVSSVESAKQQVVEIEENLGYTEIKAPFDGIVVEKFVECGDLSAPGRTLLTLQDPMKLRLEAPISEHCARRIHVSDPVNVKVASVGADIEAKVTEIVPAVDPKSRSFLVRANLPYMSELKPGMFGRLSFPCAPRRVLLVPRSAVLTRGQLDMVFVVTDGKAMLRLVRLGEEAHENVEILSGLTEGEKVIVSPPEDLYDGALVKPEDRS